MNLQEKIEAYEKYRAKLRSYRYALAIIQFDGATGAPKSGIKERSEALGILSYDYFTYKTSSDFETLLSSLEAEFANLDDTMKRIVTLERKDLDKIKKIPPKRYQEFTILTSDAQDVWEEAKNTKNYNLFKPYLEKIVAFNKEFAGYYGGAIEGSLYSRLLDNYEEGMTTNKLDIFFETLKQRIVPLLRKIQSSKVKVDDTFTRRDFDERKQIKLAEELLGLIGFDLKRGQLKESAHPFTTGISNSDTRVTTHVYKNLLLSNVYSVIHEGGHGIYDQNINENYKGSILYDGASMGIHESQSRFYENVIGRSYPFVSKMYDLVLKLFPEQLKDVTLDDFYLAANKVEPSLIRTEADELTYSLHVLLRYEMEKLMIDGCVDFDELPKIWNQKIKQYLGIEVPNDAEGILQDVHWSGGDFGYFPSYALGNVYGLQIFDRIKKELNVEKIIQKGDLTPIQDWLKKNVYVYGCYYNPNELIEKVTNEKINAEYFCKYLEEKFAKIYQLD